MMNNPHALPSGVRFWTSCPLDAMSVASKIGATVARYPSGQYVPGMILDISNNCFFGYGVTKGDGFIKVHWSTKRVIS